MNSPTHRRIETPLSATGLVPGAGRQAISEAPSHAPLDWRIFLLSLTLSAARRRASGPAAALAGIAALLASPLAAEPLDLQKTSPRTVLLEFEISADPSAVGQAYSAPYPATYFASGGVRTVTLAGSEYESFVSAYGGAWLGGVQSGTFTDFTVEIDLATLEVTGSAYGQVGGPASVATNVSTTTSGGWILNPYPPPDGPFFCPLSLPGCTPVPASPYDPQTGTLNAVGYDRLEHHSMAIDFFSFSGDLRLSEAEVVPALGGPGKLLLSALLLFSCCGYAAFRRG